MKIQNLLLPEPGICAEEELYFHREKDGGRGVSYAHGGRALRFEPGARCYFDTYFNSLSVEKWKKYTSVGSISLHLVISGSFEVVLVNKRFSVGSVSKTVIDRQILESAGKKEFVLPYNLHEYKGMLTYELRACGLDSVYYGGYYDAEADEQSLRPVDIAINICTYRREAYVRRNLDILQKSIIDNEDSAMHGHLKVYISDNGNTLPQENGECSGYVKITGNKNVGGAGGFTRGLIEIMNDRDSFNATHVLMMDDDVVIAPEALYRTYMLLRCRREEYADMSVGGAMLRMDRQNIQVEAGASWNAGRLVSNKAGIDLGLVENCLLNEIEEYTEYNAWWYCCMPMDAVSRSNLPLPLFIRGDDLEYGLRNKLRFVLMNGICVWHEPFENKYSSYLQYYIIRNLLYDNALHFSDYRLSSFLRRLYAATAREIIYYRYKNIDLLFRGVNDFYKGIGFLRSTDGEALHREIMQSGYLALPVEQIEQSENAAFSLPRYMNSFRQADRGLAKVFRYLTINGYLLPAKRTAGKEIQAVSMGLCRPINFYRQKRVLNYDEESKKAFITEKSWKGVFKALGGLIRITCVSIFSFSRAMKTFKDDSADVMSEEFWKQYLGSLKK